MKRAFISLLLIFISTASVFAQADRSQVRRGNRDFRKGEYQDAEILYRKGLLADSLSNASNYNLGNTLFKMENYQEAAKYYETVSDSLSQTKNGASLYHNLGNAKLAQKDYQGAVEAFKDALRRNPSDMETKSNLAYAQKMLKNQQDQQNQQNQDQNNDQDQNQNQDQDQQNQDQNKDQNQDKDQNKDNNDQDQNKDQNDNQQNQNDENQNDQGQNPPPKISQQDAQQMLQAIQDKENDTQEKVKKEKALMVRSKQKEKNW